MCLHVELVKFEIRKTYFVESKVGVEFSNNEFAFSKVELELKFVEN